MSRDTAYFHGWARKQRNSAGRILESPDQIHWWFGSNDFPLPGMYSEVNHLNLPGCTSNWKVESIPNPFTLQHAQFNGGSFTVHIIAGNTNKTVFTKKRYNILRCAWTKNHLKCSSKQTQSLMFCLFLKLLPIAALRQSNCKDPQGEELGIQAS